MTLLRAAALSIAIIYSATAAVSTVAASPRHAATPTLKEALTRLDGVLEEAPALMRAKEARVDSLDRRIHQALTAREAELLTEAAFLETVNYDAERALHYADNALATARAAGDKAKISEWSLKRGAVMARTEQVREAREYMQLVDLNAIDPDLRCAYYSTMALIFAHFTDYSSHEYTERYRNMAYAYEDSCLRYMAVDNPRHICIRGRRAKSEADRRAYIDHLRPLVNASELDSSDDARNAMSLARIYEEMAQPDSAQIYYALSAIAALTLCNKDLEALTRLGEMRLDGGDTSRALAYVGFALDQARSYGNIHQLNSLLSLENRIALTLQAENDRRSRFQWWLLGLLGLLAVGLAVSVVVLVKRNRRLDSSTAAAADSNRRLAEHIDSLNDARRELSRANAMTAAANSRLEEANFIKQRCLNTMFSLCSDYLARMEKQRKEVVRKLKAGQTDDLRHTMASSDRLHADVKDFYEAFDSIVLEMFPHFIEEFNELMRPDSESTPAPGELLNTTLRIHALIRLGINDSVTIASMLHCSPQTVYNNRMQVRNRSRYDKDTLATRLQSIGSAAAVAG